MFESIFEALTGAFGHGFECESVLRKQVGQNTCLDGGEVGG